MEHDVPVDDVRRSFQPLDGLVVIELTEWISGPYCGKLLADLGALVHKIEALPGGDPARSHDVGHGPRGIGKLYDYLNQNKSGRSLDPRNEAARRSLELDLSRADVLLIGEGQAALWGLELQPLRERFPKLVVVSITPYGLSGPAAGSPASDLTLWHEGGYGYGFPGLVADPERLAPLNGPGHAAYHLAGAAAVSAVLDGVLRRDDSGQAPFIDFSQLEAVAAVQFGQIVDGQRGNDRSRQSVPGAAPVPAVAILRCVDGIVAISPREQHQWLKWVDAMGTPAWAAAERFATVASREQNWDELWTLVEEWTTTRTVHEVYRTAQDARVPCLPLHTLDTVDNEAQLQSRGFFRGLTDGTPERYPTIPYHFDGFPPRDPRPAPLLDSADTLVDRARRAARPSDRTLPLTGMRILDLSWVLTGPTCTRVLAQLGAEVIKVESRKRPDLSSREWIYPSLHTGKKSCTLDLSTDEGRALVLELAAKSDLLIENFSTGVMDRLGLGVDVLHSVNPRLLVVSSSPFGRFGPSSSDLAYGSLIQSFVGWGELSRYPGEPEHQFGAIWGDPLGGMTLAYLSLAMVYARRSGDTSGHRLDLSMAESMIAALSVPYVESLVSGQAPTVLGNRDLVHAPQGAYRVRGSDEWIAITVDNVPSWRSLCRLIGRPIWGTGDLDSAADRRARADEIDEAISSWSATQESDAAVAALRAAGIAAAGIAKPTSLVRNPQLHARGFFLHVDDTPDSVVAGLPWIVDGGPRPGTTRCPEVGEDNDYVFGELLGLSGDRIDELKDRKVIY